MGYVINVASCKNGVGYGKWTHIDGWSESVIEYIRALEQTAGGELGRIRQAGVCPFSEFFNLTDRNRSKKRIQWRFVVCINQRAK